MGLCTRRDLSRCVLGRYRAYLGDYRLRRLGGGGMVHDVAQSIESRRGWLRDYRISILPTPGLQRADVQPACPLTQDGISSPRSTRAVPEG